MDNSTQLTDRKHVCPHCGEEFRQISYHWNSATDHRPELGFLQREVIRGLGAAGVMIDTQNKTPALDVRSWSLPFIIWVQQHLGELAGDIYALRRTDTNRKYSFRLRSLAHPAVLDVAAMQESWTDPWSVFESRYPVRAWYARAASVEFDDRHDYSSLYFYAEEASKQEFYSELLHGLDLNLDILTHDHGIYLPQQDAHRLVDALGPPVPGREYKWTFDHDEYHSRRKELNGWIRREVTPNPAERRLGDPTRQRPINTVHNGSTLEWSVPECVAALRRAALETTAKITMRQYKTWRDNQPESLPSSSSLGRIVGWNNMKQLAGLESNTVGGPQPKYQTQDLIEAMLRMHCEHGTLPSSREYLSWREPSEPRRTVIYRSDRYPNSWAELLDLAREQLNAD